MNLLLNTDNIPMGTLKYDYIAEKYPYALNLLAGNDVQIPAEEKAISDNIKDMKTVELTAEDILEIHENMLTRFGGEKGIRDQGQYESLSIGPYQEYFGEQLYPTVFHKAAKYLLDFAHYQAFVDGNKRTGLSTTTAFLHINGLDLTLTNEEAYKLVMDISNDIYTEVDEIVEIIKKNVKCREYKILVNKIKCNHCGDIIESNTVHDFQRCSCGTVYVDGGKNYIRRGFKNTADDFEELSEYLFL